MSYRVEARCADGFSNHPGLTQKGLVYTDERKRVHLTKQGLEIAQAVAVKYQVLMEHAVGDMSFQALKTLIE